MIQIGKTKAQSILKTGGLWSKDLAYPTVKQDGSTTELVQSAATNEVSGPDGCWVCIWVIPGTE